MNQDREDLNNYDHQYILLFSTRSTLYIHFISDEAHHYERKSHESNEQIPRDVIWTSTCINTSTNTDQHEYKHTNISQKHVVSYNSSEHVTYMFQDSCSMRTHIIVVCYESTTRELKRRLIYEYRCDERLKTKNEESTRLTDTGLVYNSLRTQYIQYHEDTYIVVSRLTYDHTSIVL